MVDRYARHTVLPEVGAAGQQRLGSSAVLVVGCGALGSVLAQLLVRAGLGRVRLVDDDVAEMHNLHRQLLYDEDDVASGRPKAELAAAKLARANSKVVVEAESGRATASTIGRLLEGIDVVVDGTDNFETRFLVNEACVREGIPWVYGGVLGTTGMVLNVVPGRGACLRCFMDDGPPAKGVPGGETYGIFSAAPVAVAAIQTTEAIKLLISPDQARRELLSLDVWTGSWRSFAVDRVADCPTCVQRRFERL